ncbi:MAG TPA: energy transducer TonB [Verrucomicrobiae bacterium]|nr:energy transducer TonB [Verrucomicrobiae bacterium]
MFQETLLESSAIHHRSRRWPKATAFAVQLLLVGVLVIVPLFSTKIIALANPPVPAAVILTRPVPDHSHAQNSSGPATGNQSPSPQATVVSLLPVTSRIGSGTNAPEPDDRGSHPAPCFSAQCGIGPGGPPSIGFNGNEPKHQVGPVKRSRIDPGQLLNQVVPTYPAIASRINLQGEVKLHAIIARDGTIQSLSVISGHPWLARAALEAVQQWRYRPYVLNGEPVEVDTYITVNFRRN